MDKLIIHCDASEVRDFHYSFAELYEHRTSLFLMLMRCYKDHAWWAPRPPEGMSTGSDWLIAGINLPNSEPITYHLPADAWERLDMTGATRLERAPEWHGYDSEVVLQRLNHQLCEEWYNDY